MFLDGSQTYDREAYRARRYTEPAPLSVIALSISGDNLVNVG